MREMAMDSTTSIPTGYVRLKLAPNLTRPAFGKAVETLRFLGGRFDNETKTWLLKESTWERNAEALSGRTERVQ
jgi:hypothetical protein